MPVSLYDALKNSYKPKDRIGHYVKDKELSNDDQQVYIKRKKNGKNKLLYTVAGTHKISDYVTDAYLGLGMLKNTSRYKNADETLKKAQAKYKPVKTVVGGHSLGGSIARGIAGDNPVYTLDKGQTIGETNAKNEVALRSKGDLVSLLGSGHIKTLPNPNFRTGILPLDALNSHNINNILNEKIFL